MGRRIVKCTRQRGRLWYTSQSRVFPEHGMGTCVSCREVGEGQALVGLLLGPEQRQEPRVRLAIVQYKELTCVPAHLRRSKLDMSVVNSEKKARCRACRGNLFTSGLQR